jgi:hypothetical protein
MEEVMSDRFTLKNRPDEISSDRSVVERCLLRILDLTGPDFQGEKGCKNAVYDHLCGHISEMNVGGSVSRSNTEALKK